jgi:phosphatidylglycerophosphate synthase
MTTLVDLYASVLVTASVAVAIASRARGSASFERVERAAPLPLVGRAPMHAVYGAVAPVARVLARLGVTASAVTLGSLALAVAAGVAFAGGHFGVGALLGSLAGFADLVDGAVARATGTASKRGEILDTLTDRYSDAALLGGIAVFVRHDLALLVLTLAAWAGASMVSFASSVLREHGIDDDGARMRRAERMAWLLASSALVPFVARALPGSLAWAHIAPVGVALAAIAVIANVSAVRRLLRSEARDVAATAFVRTPPPPTRLVPARVEDRPRARVGGVRR